MKVLTWNLKWAVPGANRERIIRNMLCDADPDLVCLTEAFGTTFPPEGETIEAGLGNFFADRKGAKKVLLWSRHGWNNSSIDLGFEPPGRIVSGQAVTTIGPVQVIGVCIPWPGSNTPRFGGTRRAWDDHLAFLETLRLRLRELQMPTIVIGDFNQRIPAARQPKRVAQALLGALERLVISTEGFRSRDGHLTIDHLAHTSDLKVCDLMELPRRHAGLELSDHFGLSAEVGPA